VYKMEIIKELERLLICKKEVDKDKLMLDTAVVYHRYMATFGNYTKIQKWRKTDREYYKNR